MFRGLSSGYGERLSDYPYVIPLFGSAGHSPGVRVSLTGLGGAAAFNSIAGLQVPPGGATRQITVTVIWQLPGQASAGTTELEMAYRMSVRELQSDKWYVNEISAATEAVGGK
jgi:hypothetical protein